MENSVKDLYKWAARSDLTIRIMMGFSVKALYKWATRSDLTIRIMTSSSTWIIFYSFLPPPGGGLGEVWGGGKSPKSINFCSIRASGRPRFGHAGTLLVMG